MRVWSWLVVAAICVCALAAPALAQWAAPPRGAPAPLIGFGLPIAGLVIGAIALARMRRRRD